MLIPVLKNINLCVISTGRPRSFRKTQKEDNDSSEIQIEEAMIGRILAKYPRARYLEDALLEVVSKNDVDTIRQVVYFFSTSLRMKLDPERRWLSFLKFLVKSRNHDFVRKLEQQYLSTFG